MKILYKTKVRSIGGRNGSIKSDDGVLDLKVGMPKELGGSGEALTNPEQLFAAGYSACFDSALNLVANQMKIKLESTTMDFEVALGMNEDGKYSFIVNIEADIKGVDKEVAQDLLEKAHQVCPYSNATRGNIEVNLSLR